MLCNARISTGDIANEMILGPVTTWLHFTCYMIWREESCCLVDDGDRHRHGVAQSTGSEKRP